MRKTESARRSQRPKSALKKLPVREDGVQTRQRLLEIAGQIFAQRGYARTTSKEICKRAGANIAAVNYHFGGKEGLYAAVLEEAHARLVSIDLGWLGFFKKESAATLAVKNGLCAASDSMAPTR